MATIVLYSRLKKEEIDKIYKDCLVEIPKWFEQNPKRRVCNIEWIYGKTFKVKKNSIKEDMEKIYKQTILETFK
jgi:hypothetical protein